MHVQNIRIYMETSELIHIDLETDMYKKGKSLSSRKPLSLFTLTRRQTRTLYKVHPHRQSAWKALSLFTIDNDLETDMFENSHTYYVLTFRY